MAVSAVVKDGKIQQTAAETSAKKATKSNSGMDKDAFLQLLVGRADAEYGFLHGIIQSILYGRKTCRSNLDRFKRRIQDNSGNGGIRYL